jgi:hypothetical protein
MTKLVGRHARPKGVDKDDDLRPGQPPEGLVDLAPEVDGEFVRRS